MIKQSNDKFLGTKLKNRTTVKIEKSKKILTSKKGILDIKN